MIASKEQIPAMMAHRAIKIFVFFVMLTPPNKMIYIIQAGRVYSRPTGYLTRLIIKLAMLAAVPTSATSFQNKSSDLLSGGFFLCLRISYLLDFTL